MRKKRSFISLRNDLSGLSFLLKCMLQGLFPPNISICLYETHFFQVYFALNPIRSLSFYFHFLNKNNKDLKQHKTIIECNRIPRAARQLILINGKAVFRWPPQVRVHLIAFCN